MSKKYLMARKICFLIIISKKVKAGIDLLIMARPTLDSREVLTRIAQKEMRRVMVFERERGRKREISRSSRKVMVLKRERACIQKQWERVHIRK